MSCKATTQLSLTIAFTVEKKAIIVNLIYEVPSSESQGVLHPKKVKATQKIDLSNSALKSQIHNQLFKYK